MKRWQFPLLIGGGAQYNSRTKNLEFLSPLFSMALQAVDANRNGS
jgi:hypothetical protein